MSLICKVNPRRGTAAIIGENIPDGSVTITRTAPGEKPYLLRGGSFDISSGGFLREDSEASFGKDLRYTLDLELAGIDTRLVQRNLALTPDFTHGLQSWSPGLDRTAKIVADPTSFSKQVGWFSGNTGAVTSVDNPFLVGHTDVADAGSTTTLTPPTSGSTAISVGDLIYIVQMHIASFPEPTIPGFTKVFSKEAAETGSGSGGGGTGGSYPGTGLYPSDGLYPGTTGGTGGGGGTSSTIRMTVWQRRRDEADTSYTVHNADSDDVTLSMFWMRNVSINYQPVIGDFVTVAPPQATTSLLIPGVTFARPSLVVSMAVSKSATVVPPPTTISNAALAYTIGGNNPRTMVVGTTSNAGASTTKTVGVSYRANPTDAVGVQIAFQANVTMSGRIIASTRVGAMPVPASGRPYLFTGRFKYRTSDLWLWEDVRNNGTWQQLQDSRGTWAAVKSSSLQDDGEYLALFVNLVAENGGQIYMQPVRVLVVNASTTNAWVEFNFYFTPTVDIPANSRLQLFHGSALREASVEWQFDRFGITSGDEIAEHNVLSWFSGDSVVPYSPEDNLFKDGLWDAVSSDARMLWDGVPGNSVSRYIGPSKVTMSTRCIIETPEFEAEVCEPVYLNDPITPPRGQWYSLIGLDPLGYTARRQLLDVINRGPQIAVSQERAWASGSLTLMTRTLGERTIAEQTFQTGRILLFRNPDTRYPENGWYLSIGDVTESRIGRDARRPERLWTIPFVRVERPSGLIDASIGQTWGQIKASGLSWGGVKNNYVNWLDVLTEPAFGALGFGMDEYNPPPSDYVPPTIPVQYDISGTSTSYSSGYGQLQPRLGGSAASMSTTSGTIVVKQRVSGTAVSTTSTTGNTGQSTLDGGSASVTTSDTTDGGTASSTGSPDVVDGQT